MPVRLVVLAKTSDAPRRVLVLRDIKTDDGWKVEWLNRHGFWALRDPGEDARPEDGFQLADDGSEKLLMESFEEAKTIFQGEHNNRATFCYRVLDGAFRRNSQAHYKQITQILRLRLNEFPADNLSFDGPFVTIQFETAKDHALFATEFSEIEITSNEVRNKFLPKAMRVTA
ncbi:hypothetical protein [Bosea sp. TAF32]|uniref:hypothetical protein n=1 Tax=Bosea sp. TAF32 TaxID=3237482 RepID=UPI003F923942